MAERKVRFYEIVNKQKERLPSQIPFDDLCDVVRNLPDDEAYVHLPRMELLGSAYDPGRPSRRAEPMIALDRITRDVHLRIERQRNYRPLTLEDGETLAEPAFFTIFDRNVLGVMRNSGSAPGPASFRDYINAIGALSGDIDVVPLADRNALRALSDVDVITRLTFAVGSDVNADVFGDSSDLIAGTVRQIRRQLGFVSIEMSVKVSPAAHDGAAEATYEQVQRLVQSDAIGFVDRAEIGYRNIEDGRARSYDFIDEAVATQADVELMPATTQPTEVSASQAMAEAYDLLYDDIRSALNSVGE